MSRRVVIIDYGSGNLRSVAKAFEHVARGEDVVSVSSNAASLAEATHVVLPGVGAFADCMNGLSSLPGMLSAMELQVRQGGKPFLGICVGMQMLFEEGQEHGRHKGLGWLKGSVVRINPADKGAKIPHMGWNELSMRGQHPILAGIGAGAHAYFVHSYHAACSQAQDVLATTHYGQELAAVVGQGQIVGTQFHPEKSQQTGLALLKNFLNM